jgi:hypothetical protein
MFETVKTQPAHHRNGVKIPAKAVLLAITLLSMTEPPGHSWANAGSRAARPDHSRTPGVVIDHLPAKTKNYIGSPSMVVLPDGRYVASHDVFGGGSSYDQTRVFGSTDLGRSWEHLTDIEGQFWSNLFVHDGVLYIMGTDRRFGNVIIRRSDDGGKTWTEPVDENNGLLVDGGRFHTAPVPMVVHNGRIWRAMEYIRPGAPRFHSFIMSAPVDADLLKAESWTVSNRLIFEKEWASQEDKLVNVLRLNFLEGGKAAVIRASGDGTQLAFDPEKDIIGFSGGAKKFTIRYDEISRRYWSLTNIIGKRDPRFHASTHRNILGLTSSADLVSWQVNSVVLRHPDIEKHGWQYIDWLFEGDDIIFVARTAYDDGLGGAHNQHDANYFTFHRLRNFRTRMLSDKPLNEKPGSLQRLKYNNPGLVVDLGVGLWAWPLPMDYDDDGDYDLVVSCPDKPYNGTYFFENTGGDTRLPVFKPAVRIGKGHWSMQISYVDDKTHVLVPAGELLHFRHKNAEFDSKIEIYPTAQIHKKKRQGGANQWKYCDYDGDGVSDLVVGVGDWTDYGWDNAFNSQGKWTNGPLHGYVYVIRNKGTKEKPVFAEPKKLLGGGKIIDLFGMPTPNLADFDGDGDLDLLCGEFVDKFTYFENVGTRTEPKYAEGRYLMHQGRPLAMDLCMIVPVALDWDKDGDVDLVVGQEDGRVALVENTGKLADRLPQFLPPVFFKQQADEVKFGALVTPYSFDWDGDGDEDLICGDTAGHIGFIENLDGGNPPRWAKPQYLKADGRVIRIQAGYDGSIQGPCEAKWGYTTLGVADWDHDGLADIITNSIWGKVLWYRNIGVPRSPKLADAKPIQVEWPAKPPKPAWTWWQPKGKQLLTQWRTTPTVIDLNEDGLNDLVMLDHEGYLSFFERKKKGGKLALLPGQRIFKDASGQLLRLNEKTAGRSGRRKLCFVDWDGDGKLDLLANSTNIDFLRNVSTTENEFVFENMGTVHERILAGHSTSPTVVDWDRNGVPDLLVGAEDGYFYYLKNPHARQSRSGLRVGSRNSSCAEALRSIGR